MINEAIGIVQIRCCEVVLHGLMRVTGSRRLNCYD